MAPLGDGDDPVYRSADEQVARPPLAGARDGRPEGLPFAPPVSANPSVVDEAMALDETVMLLALARRAAAEPGSQLLGQPIQEGQDLVEDP